MKWSIVVLQNAVLSIAESLFNKRHQMGLLEVPTSLGIDISLQNDEVCPKVYRDFRTQMQTDALMFNNLHMLR